MRKLENTTPIAVLIGHTLYCLSCRSQQDGVPHTEQEVCSYGLHPGDQILCQECETVLAACPIPTEEDYNYRDKKLAALRVARDLLISPHTAREEKQRIEQILGKFMEEIVQITGGSKDPWTREAE